MNESLVNPLVYAFLRGFLRVFVIILAFLVAWWLFNRRYPLEPYEPYFRYNREPYEPSEPPPPEYFEYLDSIKTEEGFYPGGVSTHMIASWKPDEEKGTVSATD